MTTRHKRYRTSPQMKRRLAALRSRRARVGAFAPCPASTLTISGADVRALEARFGRRLDAIETLSAYAKRRWTRFGASGEQALEAIFHITGGSDGGQWIA